MLRKSLISFYFQMTIEIPPLHAWHIETWEKITASQERLGHATLITGLEGSGRSAFVARLATALLCTDTQHKPCNTCRNCHLVSATTHPDLHVVTSESALNSLPPILLPYAERYHDMTKLQRKPKNLSTNVLIAQSRALIEEANTHSHIAKNKVFIVAQVESLTTSAANALLKILEEPADNTYWLLIASDLQRILPTISSRCQRVDLRSASRQESADWLHQNGVDTTATSKALSLFSGQPLLAKKVIESGELDKIVDYTETILRLIQDKNADVTEVADVAAKVGEGEFLLNLQRLLQDLAALYLISDSVDVNFEHLKPKLSQHSRQLNMEKLFKTFELAGSLRKQIEGGSLDKRLATEDILLAVQQL